MRILDLFADLIFPPKCAGCGELLDVKLGERRREPLCRSCRRRYENEKLTECDRCGLAMPFCRCMPDNMRRAQCESLIKLVPYRPSDARATVNGLIYSVKRYNDASLFYFIAQDMRAPLIDEMRSRGLMPEDCVISFVPRSAKNLASEGFDQGRLLSRVLSEATGIGYADCFARDPRAKEQKQLNRFERRLNMTGAFRARRASAVLRDKTLILVDDIVTSGASMASCSRMAYSLGAYSVIGVCIGRTEKKKNN